MTIYGLHDIISKYNSDYKIKINNLRLSDIANSSVAVDMGMMMYKFYSIASKHHAYDCMKNNTPFNSREIEIICIANVLIHLHKIAQYDIDIYAVFDGDTPELKKTVKSKRTEMRSKNKRRHDRALLILSKGEYDIADNDQKKLLAADISSYVELSQEFTEELAMYVRGVGLCSLEAYYEADTVCGILAKSQLVEYVLSEDGDMLVHGCPRKISIHQENVSVIILDHLLNALNISFSDFQKLCVCSGCDYNVGIPGCRMKTLFNLIPKYGSIDDVVKYSGKDFSGTNLDECLKMFNPEGSIEDYVKEFDIFMAKQVSPSLLEIADDTRIMSAIDRYIDLWSNTA